LAKAQGGRIREGRPGNRGKGRALSDVESTRQQMQAVLSALARIRGQARLMLVLRRCTLILAAATGIGLALAATDYLLHLPQFLRIGHAVVGAIAVAIVLWRRVRPAAKFSPSLVEIALRIERAGGQQAGLSGVLAAGVDFALASERGQHEDTTTLIARAERNAASSYAAAASKVPIFEWGGLLRAGAFLLLGLAPIAGSAALSPELTRIATARTLTPWADRSWPKRTEVALTDSPEASALGAALPIRAALTRTDRARGQTAVMLRFRVSSSGRTSEVRSAPMTAQSKLVKVAGDSQWEGELYERLLDPDSLAVPGVEKNATISLEYWFETSDDASPSGHMVVVPPPAIASASVSIMPPAYAAPIIAASKLHTAGHDAANEWIVGERDATPSGPTRGLVGPVLAGSRTELTIRMNKTLPELASGASAETKRAFLAAMLPGSEDIEGLEIDARGSEWKLTFDASKSLRIAATLRDGYGIASTDDAAFRIEVAADRPPTAAIVQPSQDEAVLATAVIEATAEGRDDVAMAHVELEQQAAKAPADSAGAAQQAAGDPAVIAKADASSSQEVLATTLTATSSVDLTALKLVPGDELWLTAKARDLMLAGSGGDAVVSPKRRLKIISDTELVEQVRSELAGLREAAKRAEADQSALSGKRAQAQSSQQDAAAQLSRQQAMSERLAPMKDVVKRLADRVSRNQLKDEAVVGVLKDAGEITKAASEQSDKAADALDRLSQEQKDREQNPAVKQAAGDLAKSQQKVEDSLSELANMLDRGQDDWAVRRSLEKLRTQQEQLAARTATGMQKSEGVEPEKLPADQKAQLEKLASEQTELEQKARALVSSIEQRAEQMQKTDPAQAKAMQAAVEQARKENLAQNLKEASKNIAQNQTGKAQPQQQQAAKTLSKMLEELDKTQQRQDEALKRVLADVQESLRKLITQQREQLAMLSDAMSGKRSGQGLDAGVISLHQNTLGVQTTVREQVKKGEKLLSLLSSAGEAQSAAIVALRAAPQDQPEADSTERTSLTRLNEALAEAERMEEQAEEREEDRKRAELKKQYAEILELETAVQVDAKVVAGQELDRRQRAAARALAARQEELRQKMDDIRKNTSDIGDAAIFDFSHQRFDAVSQRASKPLAEGNGPESVSRDLSSAVRIVQGLVQALSEADKKKDQFKQDEEEEGGGGGSGPPGKQPAIPPIAELRMLRTLQAEAAELTRAVGEQQSPEVGDLETVTELQTKLAKFGADLLKKIKQSQEDGSGHSPVKERN